MKMNLFLMHLLHDPWITKGFTHGRDASGINRFSNETSLIMKVSQGDVPREINNWNIPTLDYTFIIRPLDHQALIINFGSLRQRDEC